MPNPALAGGGGPPLGLRQSSRTSPEWEAALRTTVVAVVDALSQPERDRPARSHPKQQPILPGRAASPPDAARPDADAAGAVQPTAPDMPSTGRATASGTERSDAELVAAAQADPAAFADLYERYFVPIYRYCLVRLGNATDAEDIASVVFARALGSLPRFTIRPHDPGGGFRSWLFAIAHNALANAHRDHRPTMPLDAADTVATSEPSPEDQAIAADRLAQLRAALDRLPVDQRRVVELRLAGLSGPEIAQRSPRATVPSRCCNSAR